MSVSNTSVHDNTADSIKNSFKATTFARMAYSKSVSRNEDVTMNFYSKSVEPSLVAPDLGTPLNTVTATTAKVATPKKKRAENISVCQS